jgi:hypothetical protein
MNTRLPSCKITGAILVAVVLFMVVLVNAPRAHAAPAEHVRANRYLPVCSVEDASSGPVPCVWPAFAAGNNEGRSFRVYRDGHFKHISDARAFELVGGCDSDGPLFCRVMVGAL